jgi:hypothetical protein
MTVSGCPSWACVRHMTGCVNGVAIDIDTYTEGWFRDVVYPVAPCHPRYCETCHGTGRCTSRSADIGTANVALARELRAARTTAKSGWSRSLRPRHRVRSQANQRGPNDDQTTRLAVSPPAINLDAIAAGAGVCRNL